MRTDRVIVHLSLMCPQKHIILPPLFIWFILSKCSSYLVRLPVRNGTKTVTFSCYSLSDTWMGRALVHLNEEPNLFPDLSVLYFSATLLPFWPGMLYSKKVLIGTGRTLSSFPSIRHSPEKETNLCRGRLKVLDCVASIVD